MVHEFALPRPFILLIVPLIGVPIAPVIDPISVFLVKHVMTLIGLILVFIGPDSIAIAIALLEVTCILASILPQVRPVAFAQSIDKPPIIHIAIGIGFPPDTMFQPIPELTFIDVT